MRRTLRDAGLAAALLLTCSAMGASVTLIEELPAKLAIDGDLGEWTEPPSLILGAADQVAGPSKPSSTVDLAAKIWVAIDTDGVAIAGEVTDDKVLFGTAKTIVNADHLELWLAFPAAPLPTLGFANQFGETELHWESDCDGEIDRPDACKQWLAKQTRRRATLGRIFVRQYLLGGTGLSEA